MLRVQRPLAAGSMLLRNPLSACLIARAAAPSGCGGGGGGRRGKHGGVIVPESSLSSSASAWRKPEAGRLKLNFDGSSRRGSGRASIGGVVRDHEGAFVLGYAERIGAATSSAAELAALRRGLELAVANGWRGVWIEGDAMAAVDVVARRRAARVRVRRAEEERRLCAEIEALLPLLGDDVAVSHVRRGGNRVAHGFAKLGHGAARPLVWRDTPPDEVLRSLQRDAEGE